MNNPYYVDGILIILNPISRENFDLRIKTFTNSNIKLFDKVENDSYKIKTIINNSELKNNLFHSLNKKIALRDEIKKLILKKSNARLVNEDNIINNIIINGEKQLIELAMDNIKTDWSNIEHVLFENINKPTKNVFDQMEKQIKQTEDIKKNSLSDDEDFVNIKKPELRPNEEEVIFVKEQKKKQESALDEEDVIFVKEQNKKTTYGYDYDDFVVPDDEDFVEYFEDETEYEKYVQKNFERTKNKRKISSTFESSEFFKSIKKTKIYRKNLSSNSCEKCGNEKKNIKFNFCSNCGFYFKKKKN